MQPLPLFDRAESQRRKDVGMERAEHYNYTTEDWLRDARAVACKIAERKGTVTSDDVQAVFPLADGVHQNAIGSIFKGKAWECVGFTKTSKVSGHRRTIMIWKLMGM